MGKIFSIIISFILGQFKGHHDGGGVSYEALIDRAVDSLKFLLESLALSLTGFTLTIAGFLVSYFNLLTQYDQTGSIALNAVTIGGFILIFIGLIIVFTTLSQKKLDGGLKTSPQAIPTKTASPLEEALSLLILDYMKEREIDRQERAHAKSETQNKKNNTQNLKTNLEDNSTSNPSSNHAEYFSRHGSV